MTLFGWRATVLLAGGHWHRNDSRTPPKKSSSS